MVIEDLRESWADMFSHIDDLVEMIGNEYPEFSSFVNRDIIQKAVLTTQRLDKIIEQAKIQSEKNQGDLFNDND
jgi:hypothetical protein